MKGASQLMMIILLLLIGTSLVIALYYWSTDTLFKIYPEEAEQHSYQRSRACLSINKIEDNYITIKNCGLVPLQDFKLYFDDSLIENIALEELLLEPKQTFEFEHVVVGGVTHGYLVTADLAESAYVTK